MAYTQEQLGGSFIIRNDRGEVVCFRPDEASANRAIELLDRTGQYTELELDSVLMRKPNGGLE